MGRGQKSRVPRGSEDSPTDEHFPSALDTDGALSPHGRDRLPVARAGKKRASTATRRRNGKVVNNAIATERRTNFSLG